MKTRQKNRALFKDTYSGDVMGGLSTVERKSLEGAFSIL